MKYRLEIGLNNFIIYCIEGKKEEKMKLLNVMTKKNIYIPIYIYIYIYIRVCIYLTKYNIKKYTNKRN